MDSLVAWAASYRLKREIRRSFSFLFEEFGAQFITTKLECSSGKVVTLATHNIQLRVSAACGEYDLAVAPGGEAGREWVFLSDALIAIGIEKADHQFPISSLSDIAPMLRSRFALMEIAFGDEQFSGTKVRLERIKASKINQMNSEVATRLASNSFLFERKV